MKIGFFDSGKGGEVILDAVRAYLPSYDYLYYGDTAHVPFGDRSEEEIYTLTENGVRWLFEQGALLVIVACNTASAESLRRLQDTFLVREYSERRVLGVIIPTIEEIMQSGSVYPFLIGTKRTIESRKYEKELQKKGATHIELKAVSTPELVPLIEAGEYEQAFTALCSTLDSYKKSFDTLILGCTHYTILKNEIRAMYKSDFRVLAQDEIIPYTLQRYLRRHPEIEGRLFKTGSVVRFYTNI